MNFSVRNGFALIAVSAFGLVAFGLVIQEIYKLHPCPLCIFQRLLYIVIGLLALVAVAFPAARKVWGAALILISAGGLATATYQSWLQQAQDASKECGYGEPSLIEQLVDWLGMQWSDMFMATGFCSSKEWVFLQLSIANWSIVCFAAYLAFALWLALRRLG
jgi:disulfide bond formation protein DsbB